MVTLLKSAEPVAASYIPNDTRRSLVGLSREQLTEILGEVGVPEKQRRMRMRQLWHWIYNRGYTEFSRMTDISKDMQRKLDEMFVIGRPEVVTEQISSDGTRKWLLRLAPDERGQRHEIETVYIPEEDRGTLCISSQVGCTLTCTFCHTGTQKLVRNLTAGEIAGQIMLARDKIKDWPADLEANPQPPSSGRYVTNVVLMGMGEPLYNFDNVKGAIDIASDGEGLSLSKRRITLSTSGVVPEIVRAGDEIGSSLAISLHGTTDEVRNKLVPLNKKYPIKELLEACRNYPGSSNARRITFEYVMLKGVNDTKEDAKRLVQLLKGIPAKVNLIPFNPWPGTAYECSEWDVIEAFAEILNNAGYASPVRTPRGRDIMAACGQLKSESQKVRASERTKAEASL
ncbi:23S rRNA (adenine(2503)-C(2))-methyltransferase RlmN [Aestuariivirga litoralis]|uniref:23S rRNA (adenine(2503)-C(2))-methyltransferase RlmN n=1 Tax=Aestuariivirga litoralis TaxID=2650924 RepID=UPI0018C8239F|nr:23S rRNA (adenine(2503)-C(2))-methyltransferase RlmN [Aestuariivirga litoralis]MBG1233523.1 23S rRNA (adenine(2503)-C(2))-methyltransferase RlmN [Aestuariivirga litoralis]